MSEIPKKTLSFSVYVRDTMDWLKKEKKLTEYEAAKIEHQLEAAFAWRLNDLLADAVRIGKVKKEVRKPLAKKDLEALLIYVRRLVKRTMKFKPEWPDNLLKAHAKANGYPRSAVDKGDGDAPFYSEVFLYPLLTKDVARSVLYPMEELAQVLDLEE